MRKALYPSGSKDDPRDADLLLDLLLQHRNKLHRWSPDTEATRRVVEERRKLVDEKTAQTNRLTSHLKIYFPQILNWFERLDTELVCALLERWPTLEELQKVPPAKLRTFFRKHHCRDEALIRAPHPCDWPGHSCHSGSGGDRGQEYGREGDRADRAQLGGGHCGFRRDDRGGGGGASGFFYL
jgi:hypothetical protein